MAAMVYITELDTGTRIALPLPPESVKCKAETKFISYNIINVGEVKLPNGEKLTKFSWSGRLPGESMKHMRIVSAADWRSPKEIQSIFSIWRNRGKKLRLLVTGTTINHDVYLENYTVDNSRLDTVEYSISFTHAKDIKVYTTAELNIQETRRRRRCRRRPTTGRPLRRPPRRPRRKRRTPSSRETTSGLYPKSSWGAGRGTPSSTRPTNPSSGATQI